MELSDDLLCLFNTRIEARDGTHVIEVPARELDVGDLEVGEVYRIAVLPAHEARADGATSESQARPRSKGRRIPEPPVKEGDVRDVRIEDIGEQGDGIARVERGYIVFVPGTDVGDEVTIEITTVSDNFAFGDVVDEDDDQPLE